MLGYMKSDKFTVVLTRILVGARLPVTCKVQVSSSNLGMLSYCLSYDENQNVLHNIVPRENSQESS